jgi:hypothetical protein
MLLYTILAAFCLQSVVSKITQIDVEDKSISIVNEGAINTFEICLGDKDLYKGENLVISVENEPGAGRSTITFDNNLKDYCFNGFQICIIPEY